MALWCVRNGSYRSGGRIAKNTPDIISLPTRRICEDRLQRWAACCAVGCGHKPLLAFWNKTKYYTILYDYCYNYILLQQQNKPLSIWGAEAEGAWPIHPAPVLAALPS